MVESPRFITQHCKRKMKSRAWLFTKYLQNRTALVPVAVIKHCAQKQLPSGESVSELKARTWRQELMQKSWIGAAYWLGPRGFLRLLFIVLRTSKPGAVPLTKAWPCHVNQWLRNCTTGFPQAHLMGALCSCLLFLFLRFLNFMCMTVLHAC